MRGIFAFVTRHLRFNVMPNSHRLEFQLNTATFVTTDSHSFETKQSDISTLPVRNNVLCDTKDKQVEDKFQIIATTVSKGIKTYEEAGPGRSQRQIRRSHTGKNTSPYRASPGLQGSFLQTKLNSCLGNTTYFCFQKYRTDRHTDRQTHTHTHAHTRHESIKLNFEPSRSVPCLNLPHTSLDSTTMEITPVFPFTLVALPLRTTTLQVCNELRLLQTLQTPTH